MGQHHNTGLFVTQDDNQVNKCWHGREKQKVEKSDQKRVKLSGEQGLVRCVSEPINQSRAPWAPTLPYATLNGLPGMKIISGNFQRMI